jgi:hypothetical protein
MGNLPFAVLPTYRIDFEWKLQHFLFVKATLDIQVAYKPSSHRLVRVKVWRYMYIIIAWCSNLVVEAAFQDLLAERVPKDIVSILRTARQISDANLENHTMSLLTRVHRRRLL